LDGDCGTRADALADVALDDVREVLLPEAVTRLVEQRLREAAGFQVVLERALRMHPAELAEIEGEEFEGEMTAGQDTGQLARQQLRVRAGDDEVIVLRALELRAEPLLPAGHALEFVQEEVGFLESRMGPAERGHPGIQQGVVESPAQTRVFEVQEGTVSGVEPITFHHLRQQRRLPAAPNALHHERERITQARRQGDVAWNCRGDRVLPEAPVRGDLEETVSIHAVQCTRQSADCPVYSTLVLVSSVFDSLPPLKPGRFRPRRHRFLTETLASGRAFRTF